MLPALLLATALAAEPSFCGEAPDGGAPASLGRASKGRLQGGVRLVEGPSVRVLPRRHRARCLDFATPRLVEALARAGEAVQRAHPGSPPLGVGDLARARGGPIRPISRSHQNGRDADLAFYALDASGRPVTAEDLASFDAEGRGPAGSRFDVARNWTLIAALLRDPSIELRWIFVAAPLRRALLAEGVRVKSPGALLARAREVLHQPSDAPPHDDHFHLRLRCTRAERALGCVD